MANSDSDLKVTILGSGTCVPSLERSSCSVLIQGESGCFLLDAGPGTMHQLLRAGVEIYDIDALFLSHFHMDHSGEFPAFLFSTKYPDFKKRRNYPLMLVGGEGFRRFFKDLNRAFNRHLEFPPGMLEIHELMLEPYVPVVLNGFTIDYAPVDHNPESRAFQFTDSKGRRIVYSGDTDYCEDLIALAKGADLFICESALPDEKRAPKHCTPSIAGDMAAKAQVKKLVLTHFYPECDAVDLKAQCRRSYKGPLVLAEDLMEIFI